MSAVATRDEAYDLLCDWVDSPSLRRHCLAVEAAMAHYAEQSGEDVELWSICGLLHDADYERHPEMDDAVAGHPRTIMAHLREVGAPADLIDAIAGHAPYLGVPRTTAMAKTLFAVDELAGFIVACTAVRPGGIDGLTPKSVKKKLKTLAFAAAVNREDIRIGAEELGVDLDAHIATVIAALDARSAELGLRPTTDG